MTTEGGKLHHYKNGKVVLYMRGKYWQARMKLPTGKWHRISTKQTDLNEAAEIACDRFDDVKFREKHNMSLLTKKFSHVAQATINDLQEQLDSGYGKETYKHYIGAIKRYLIPYFGNHNVDTIDYKKLMEFDKWRIKKIGHKPRQSTINNHNSALKKVFSVALANNWMSEYRVPDLKNTGTKSDRRASFSADEYRQLYVFMRKWHKTGRKEITRQIRTLLRDYVLILANTGMRHGTEATRLKWNNIEEFELKGEKYFRIYVDGKTGKRELIANTSVEDYFKRIQGRFDTLKDMSFAELFKVDEYVFRLENGNRPKDLHGAFEILLRDAKLLHDKHGRRRSLYSLRHNYATKKLIDGLNIHVLAKQMGTSVAMIEDHYSHLIPSLSADRIVNMKKI